MDRDWKLFGAFWIFVFPLFWIDLDTTTTSSPIMALISFIVGAIGWLGFIASTVYNSIIKINQEKKKALELRKNGKKVQAKITEKVFIGKTEEGYEIILLVFEFENYVGTKITGTFRIADTKPNLKRYEEGCNLALVLGDEKSRFPYLGDGGEIVKTKSDASAYLYIAFIVLYCVVSFIVECFLIGKGEWRHFLALYLPWVWQPFFGIVIGRFESFVNANDTFGTMGGDITDNRLILYGKKAIAELIAYSQTGTYINEQPEMKFSLAFTDDKGQKHTVTYKAIVYLEDLHNLKKGEKYEVLYYYKDPQVAKICGNIEPEKKNYTTEELAMKEEMKKIVLEILEKRKNEMQ